MKTLVTCLSVCVLLFGIDVSAQTSCTQMPITTEFIKSSKAASSAYEHMLCDSDFKTHQEAINAGIAIGALVYDVPLKLTGTFTQSQKDTWKHDHCEGTRSRSQYAETYEAVIKLVTPEAYKAWTDCQTKNAFGLACWMEQPSEDDWDTLTLRTSWRIVPGDKGSLQKSKIRR